VRAIFGGQYWCRFAFALPLLPSLFRIASSVSDIPISIDTRRAAVGRAAVHAGADIVNDVSGGCFDQDMMRTVSELGVPMVLMHMRGTPETMQSQTRYHNVVADVAEHLSERSKASTRAGIARWIQILDPGIGFGKDMSGNLALLRNLHLIRQTTGQVPLLIGTSRKGFIGKIAGVEESAQRDPGTIASVVAAVTMERSALNNLIDPQPCTIVRVHDAAATGQAVKVMDAIVSRE
jgi:dihydropteroate synthase